MKRSGIYVHSSTLLLGLLMLLCGYLSSNFSGFPSSPQIVHEGEQLWCKLLIHSSWLHSTHHFPQVTSPPSYSFGKKEGWPDLQSYSIIFSFSFWRLKGYTNVISTHAGSDWEMQPQACIAMCQS